MTTECRRVEGILATSIYEPLSAPERERLDAHLDACHVCRETLRGFEGLVRDVPVQRPELGVDLLPAIRQTLGQETPGRSRRFRRQAVALAAAASFVAIALAGGYAAMSPDAPLLVPVQEAGHSGSPLDRTFEQVDQLMEARFHSRAFLMLDTAVRRFPDDPRAPEALQRAAKLAFDELHWYPEAHVALRKLRDRYREQFESDSANRIALEMLEESYEPGGDYLALRLLDTARNNGDFDGYERVLTTYPGTYIAGRALDEMTAALAVDGDVVSALETLAESCTHPMAVVQVKLRLARTLDGTDGSRDRIRSLYEEAAASDSIALSDAARSALRELDNR